MKTFRYFLISFLLALTAFSTVTYTACNNDRCKNVVCQNGGSCLNAKCTCPSGFTGSKCETNLCAGITCYNGGMCVSGTCNCPAGYEGQNCEILNKFIGNYTAYDSCNSGTITKLYITAITMKGTGEPVLKITGFGNYNTTAYASLVPMTDQFNIQGTTYEGYAIEGSGFYENGHINIGYTVSFGTTFNTCSGVWVKQ